MARQHNLCECERFEEERCKDCDLEVQEINEISKTLPRKYPPELAAELEARRVNNPPVYRFIPDPHDIDAEKLNEG